MCEIFQCHISRKFIIYQQQSNGGSKPPPYHVVVCAVSFATAFGCLSLTTQLLLFRKNHARLACSVVNALTTAHCRYQLLRILGDHRSPLRYVVVCTVSLATAFSCLSLTMQLLLFRKNHARLACSVVNALTTAHCRYQLLRFTGNRIFIGF